MKTNKKILSTVLASTTMLSALSSYVAVAETTPGTPEQTARVVEIGEGKDNTTFPRTLEENTTYKLTSDITLAATLTVNKSVTIDLNGKTLTAPKTGSGISVTNGSKLTITDSSPDVNGTITNSSEKTSGYLINVVKGTVEMNDGNIINDSLVGSYMVRIGSCTDDGLGRFILNDGKVADNKGYGAFKVEEKPKNELVINGGKVCGPTNGKPSTDNFVFEGGIKVEGVAILNYGSTKISGGEITGAVWACTCTGGSFTAPTVTVEGDAAINGTFMVGQNSHDGDGGAPVIDMNGGTFTGDVCWTNRAQGKDAVSPDGKINITGGIATVGKIYVPVIDNGDIANQNTGITFGKDADVIYTPDENATEGEKAYILQEDENGYIHSVSNKGIVLNSITEGNDTPETMTGEELARYVANKGFYDFSEIQTDTDGNYTITVNSKVGKMKGDPAAVASEGKNVLLILTFDKLDELTIKKGSTVLNTAQPSWFTDGDKFVDNADETKKYVTLWISLTEDRLNGTEDVEYTISGKNCGEKTLTVKFNDTTEYKFDKDESLTETDYTVTCGDVDENGKATVTVNPVTGKSITTAKVKYADNSYVTLASDGKGGYSDEVEVKKFLTEQEVKEGTVNVKLKDANLEVETATMSETIKAVGMTVGIEAPSTMTDPDELTRYQDNRKLYTANDIVWDETSRTATVKVPAELMKNNTSINSGNGQGAANVCLILKLEDALVKENGTYGLTATGIEDIDVEDGWKFVDGATEDNKGKYVVLWINAGESAFTNGTKTVVYKTAGGDVIATVNLVKIPGVKSAKNEVNSVAVTDITEAKIVEEAQKNLGIDSNANLGELDFIVGTLPTTTGDSEVDVTVKAKSGSECVLVDKDGNVDDKLKTTVKVTVEDNATATVTIEAPTGGTFTAKTADGATITTDDSVEVGEEITLSATANSGYNFSSWSVTDAAGNSVTVSSNKFTMPAGGVTINATFTQKSSGGGNHGGGSYGGGGSSYTPSTSIYVPYATIPDNKNAVKEDVKVTAKPGTPVADEKSGITVKTEENEKAAKDSSIKISAPENTFKLTDLAEEVLKNTPGSQLAETKKSVEEGVKAVAAGNGFALNVEITKDGKTVEPDRNVEVTVPVPEAFKDKKLYVYRLTERGAVPVLARTVNNKVTAFAGGSGTFIFTTEKLENAPMYKKGSVDLDGATTAKDATLVLKHIVELNTLKDEKLFMADVNGDGYVNAKDATEILKMVVSLA